MMHLLEVIFGKSESEKNKSIKHDHSESEQISREAKTVKSRFDNALIELENMLSNERGNDEDGMDQKQRPRTNGSG